MKKIFLIYILIFYSGIMLCMEQNKAAISTASYLKYRCTIGRCKSSYRMARSLKSHVVKNHVMHFCKLPPCNNIAFLGGNAFHNHIISFHKDLFACGHPGCNFHLSKSEENKNKFLGPLQDSWKF